MMRVVRVPPAFAPLRNCAALGALAFLVAFVLFGGW